MRNMGRSIGTWIWLTNPQYNQLVYKPYRKHNLFWKTSRFRVYTGASKPHNRYSATKNHLFLIAAWVSYHMPSKVWDEVTYPFQNFNGCTVEVWEWISNFIPLIIMNVITYPKHGTTFYSYIRQGTGRMSNMFRYCLITCLRYSSYLNSLIHD